jgi:hypothetical protein
VQVPDYFLARPPGWKPGDIPSFEHLYADQVAPRTGARIDYRLAAPRWQFLCWLADTKDVLLHGSGRADLVEFEPRRPADTSEFGGQRAVFASSDGIWALFFAVEDRRVATSLVNASVVAGVNGVETSLYYFSVNQEALVANAWQVGTVYVLPREGFDRQPDSEWNGVPITSNQWASLGPVRQLASLTVSPDDFPFLRQVNGHDQPTVTARAAKDPDAFPWRE